MEEYTYTEQKKAHLVLCVFDRKGNYPGEKMCAGPLCMGWVHELDETGTPTNRGRCGLVHKHWWEAKEEEKKPCLTLTNS